MGNVVSKKKKKKEQYENVDTHMYSVILFTMSLRTLSSSQLN